MPISNFEVKSSWADDVEEGEHDETTLHLPSEVICDGMKTVTEYKMIDGKKCKVIRQYRIEKHLVSKSIAKRKTWKKFGSASNDPPGPNPTNTIAAEDVFMQFVSNKESMQDEKQDNDDPFKNAKNVKCRLCKEEHWTIKCPYKNSLGPLQDTLKAEEKPAAASGVAEEKAKSGKYVPPSMREGGNRRGESMQLSRSDKSATIRVTNLSEDVKESDLQQLFRPFGSIDRYYLAMDKQTQQSKGFAFVTFHRKEDAAKAISCLSGYGYDHLILNVEWAKPPSNN
ncbi:Eukaryotic translation initiation factor 3 subunit G [Chamberlinius hualienensis]